jgi:outer membrane protein TolC
MVSKYSLTSPPAFLALLLLLSLSFPVAAQGTLSLEDALRKARERYPLSRQVALIEESKKTALSSTNSAYLPQVELAGKASYQSAVTKLPVDFSAFGQAPIGQKKDQYQLALQVSQVIWDGGGTGAKKEIVRKQAEAQKKAVEAQLYQLKAQVLQLYFGVLRTDALLTQNELAQEQLESSHKKISALMQSGMANATDLAAVKIEQLVAEQNKSNLLQNRKFYLTSLATLTGDSLDPGVVLKMPGDTAFSGKGIRPEVLNYAAEEASLDAQERSISAGLMPRLGLFATAGYGRPGLNLLSGDFDFYWTGGAQLVWNLGNFYNKRNQQRDVVTRKEMVATNRETFLLRTQIQKSTEQSKADAALELLKSDSAIIALRTAQRVAFEKRVESGTASGADWIAEMAQERIARQNKAIHEIDYLLALYNLKFYMGELE